MQHQSQDLNMGPTAGKTGILVSGAVITSAEIERHIAEGKRMQAEAVAAFLTGSFRRVASLFHRRSEGGAETAMPHRA